VIKLRFGLRELRALPDVSEQHVVGEDAYAQSVSFLGFLVERSASFGAMSPMSCCARLAGFLVGASWKTNPVWFVCPVSHNANGTTLAPGPVVIQLSGLHRSSSVERRRLTRIDVTTRVVRSWP